MSVEPDPIDGKSAVEIDNVPSKSNYVASNAAGASTKIKVFALILTAAGITGIVLITIGVTNTITTQAPVVSSTAEAGTTGTTAR